MVWQYQKFVWSRKHEKYLYQLRKVRSFCITGLHRHLWWLSTLRPQSGGAHSATHSWSPCWSQLPFGALFPDRLNTWVRVKSDRSQNHFVKSKHILVGTRGNGEKFERNAFTENTCILKTVSNREKMPKNWHRDAQDDEKHTPNLLWSYSEPALSLFWACPKDTPKNWQNLKNITE